MASAEPSADSNLVELSRTPEEDVETAQDVSAHLAASHHNNRRFTARHSTHRARTFLGIVTSGSKRKSRKGRGKADAEEEEVGDDWFGVKESKGIVRLRVSKARDQIAMSIRRLVRSSEDGGDGQRVKGKGKRTKHPIAATLDTVEEGSLAIEHGQSYADSSRGDSRNDSRTSLDTTSPSLRTLDSRPDTPNLRQLDSRVTAPVPLSLISSASTSHSSDFIPLQPNRTLTLDESQPKSRRRRDPRSDFTPHKHTLNLNNLQRILARRVRRVQEGGIANLDEGEAEILKALVEAGVKLEDKEEYIYDILYEHQRGFMSFGLPKFSSAALAQFDPAPWTDGHFKNSPYTIQNHPLPSPFWVWDQQTWMVEMAGDSDEQGWSYAFRFRSSHWRGEPDTWRSFVRRRRWIRGRIHRPLKLPDPSTPLNKIDWKEYESSLRNSAFADRRTPGDGQTISRERESGDITEENEARRKLEGPEGIRNATALLPLSSSRKDDILGWEQAIDPFDPFLAWDYIKKEGDTILQKRKERLAGAQERSEEDLIGIWKDAVVEINYRRITRVLKGARLDREKMEMWNWWFGKEAIDVELTQIDLCETGPGKEIKRLVLVNGGEGEKRPDLNDVWDLVEGRVSAHQSGRRVEPRSLTLSLLARSSTPSIRIPALPSRALASHSLPTSNFSRTSSLQVYRSFPPFRAGESIAGATWLAFRKEIGFLDRCAGDAKVLRRDGGQIKSLSVDFM